MPLLIEIMTNGCPATGRFCLSRQTLAARTPIGAGWHLSISYFLDDSCTKHAGANGCDGFAVGITNKEIVLGHQVLGKLMFNHLIAVSLGLLRDDAMVRADTGIAVLTSFAFGKIT